VELSGLLRLVMDKKASDLFITAGYAPSYKLDGKIYPVTLEKLSADEAKTIILGLLSVEQQATLDATGESNFAFNAPDIGRFRVNAHKHQNQLGMVLRRVESHVPSMQELMLPKILGDIAMYRQGLVMVAGSTGAGKSTTLAAMTDHRNRNSNGHIVCVEDPIEFVHRPVGCIITQREVGLDTESFEAGLRNALRQAPDMIVIGEIRTRESMLHAMQFAETGHLCLATIHASNANQVLDRVLGFFPEDRHSQVLMDLSLNLKAVIAQRLLPAASGKGGRVAVEILMNTPLVAAHIRKGEIHLIREVMRKGDGVGMQTFDKALFQLYQAGEITYDDAIRNADSGNELRLMVKLGRTHTADQPGGSLEGASLVDNKKTLRGLDGPLKGE